MARLADEYPRELGITVARFRQQARHGLRELSIMGRRAYGNAVLEAIRGLQKARLRRTAVPASRPNCASRTFEQTGAAILKAVAAQNRAACRYYGSGGSSCSYSRSVAKLKATIQANIDLLL